MRTLEELTRDLERAYDCAEIDDAPYTAVHNLIAHVQQQTEQLATLTARVAALESAGKVQTPAKLDEAPAAPPPPAAPAPASDDYEARARRYLADLWGVSVPAELEPFEGDVLKLAALFRTVADETMARLYNKAERYDPTLPRTFMGWPPEPAQVRSLLDELHSAKEKLRTVAAEARREERAAYEALALKFVRSEGLHEPCDAFVARLATLLRTVADEARREERAACEAVCREVAGGWAGAPRVAAIECIDRIAARECADRIAARGKGE